MRPGGWVAGAVVVGVAVGCCGWLVCVWWVFLCVWWVWWGWWSCLAWSWAVRVRVSVGCVWVWFGWLWWCFFFGFCC
ncbi:hypothetical protein RA276_28380, partial [Pseudomonas syringae pv. tagetis]|uniref:hypothetical protein n=1 Tax=Pseudomonas syringae group genomosp. 7 TaxID=251699 RepID=UPI00376F5792